MDYVWGTDEEFHDVGTQCSDEISEDVHHNDDGSREFYCDSLLEADQQRHRHCQDSQEQLVLDTTGTASQGDSRMKDGEDVYYPCCLDPFHILSC